MKETPLSALTAGNFPCFEEALATALAIDYYKKVGRPVPNALEDQYRKNITSAVDEWLNKYHRG